MQLALSEMVHVLIFREKLGESTAVYTLPALCNAFGLNLFGVTLQTIWSYALLICSYSHKAPTFRRKNKSFQVFLIISKHIAVLPTVGLTHLDTYAPLKPRVTCVNEC